MARALLLVVVFLAVAYTGAIKDSMHVSVDEDPVVVANIIKERIRRQAGSCDAADIAFVLDSSGSIQKTDSDGWNKILTFAKRMVGTFNVAQDKTRIAVMTFSGNIGTIIKLNQYGNGAAVQNAIGNLAYRDGPTNTPLALRTLNEVVFNEANGDRKDIANFALTMTDGVPNMQNQEVDHVIDMISKVRTEVQRIKERPQPITMFAIGVALDKIPENVRRYGNVTLETIASRPSYTFSITDFAALDAIHDVVVNAIGEACRTSGRECYIADLAFMIDSSGSIQRTDAQGWSKSKEFAKAIIEHFPVAQDKIRVAVLTFSSNIGTVINFKDYGDRQKLIDAVMRLQFLDGTTDTPKALERLDSSVFTVANGDRAAVPDFVVALTDGVPNTEGEEVDHVRMMVGRVKTAADKLKNRARPITMFAIGIALDKIRPEVRQFGQETLNHIASKPSYAFSITDFDALETIVLDIKNSIKDECGDVTTTTPAPTTPVKEPDRPCKENTDVYFIVDESGSIGYQNFELMKKFVSDTVDKLNIASDKTQVGLITFSTDPSFKWGLNKYSSRRGLRDAVKRS